MGLQLEAGALPAEAVRKLQQIAHEQLGLEQRAGKELVISMRAGRHMRELGIDDVGAYLKLIENDQSGDSLRELLDLLTTNHTSFWREASHFEWFEKWLSQGRGGQPVTVWCAASSTGEEPYTLAMLAREVLGPSACGQFRVLATDISTKVLNIAEQGVYPADRVALLPGRLASRYFEPCRDRRPGKLRVTPEIRQMVHFKRLNLIRPLPKFGPFPVIFCRNVMIYFSQETRTGIVRKLLTVTSKNGYLVVGHAEGLAGLEAEVEFVQPAIYRNTSGGPSDKDLKCGWTAPGDEQWQHS